MASVGGLHGFVRTGHLKKSASSGLINMGFIIVECSEDDAFYMAIIWQ